MVFQGYLFVLVAAVAWFASAQNQTYTVQLPGRREQRYLWLPALMITVPLIVIAATRDSGFADTYAYLLGFRGTNASLSAIPEALTGAGKDKGFRILNILIKMLVGENRYLYFGIIAAICLLSVAYIYRKYSCNFAMSMFLFIASSDYIQWTHNGMRQFIAAAVIFAATDMLLQRKYLRYYAIVGLMATIHASALIMIPVSLFVLGWPWNRRTVLFTLGALTAINFSGGLQSLIADFMSETQYSGEVKQFLNTEGTNVFRVIVFCIPPLMALVFRSRLMRANTPILDLATNMSIISMGLYIISSVTSGMFIGRLPIYFSLYNYILLPWLIEAAFDKRSQKLVYGCVIVCYLVFYWFQITVTWGISAAG